MYSVLSAATIKNDMKRIILSCFGLGRLPLAPGTWGSLPPVIIFALMYYLGAHLYTISIVMAALVLAGSIACITLSPDVIKELGSSDPREVVADELAGQALMFLPLPLFIIEEFTLVQVLLILLFGFLLFRLFDILKPYPIYELEKLREGWGILADDLVAGMYAAIVLQGCLLFIIVEFFYKNIKL